VSAPPAPSAVPRPVPRHPMIPASVRPSGWLHVAGRSPAALFPGLTRCCAALSPTGRARVVHRPRLPHDALNPWPCVLACHAGHVAQPCAGQLSHGGNIGAELGRRVDRPLLGSAIRASPGSELQHQILKEPCSVSKWWSQGTISRHDLPRHCRHQEGRGPTQCFAFIRLLRALGAVTQTGVRRHDLSIVSEMLRRCDML
jgi:hypothetical protein